MAKAENNVLFNGISGKYGNVILKNYSYGTVISKIPDRSKVVLSVKQKKANSVFKEAVAYAKSVLADPKLQKQYKTKLKKKGSSLYHIALSDYLKKSKTKK